MTTEPWPPYGSKIVRPRARSIPATGSASRTTGSRVFSPSTTARWFARFSRPQSRRASTRAFPVPAAALAALALAASAGSKEAADSVDDFLPTAATIDAVYVQIERDPGFDDFSRRMQEARDENPEWAAEYYREHQTNDRSPLPYHENFGVPREEYEHYVEPMNHYREVARQDIRICRKEQNGRVVLEFEGEDLLFSRLVIDLEANTVATAAEQLPRHAFIELERASLPPGVHRGVLFRTPESRIRQTHRRESLLIGEVAELDAGIIHFGVRTPEGNERAYVRFAR